MSYPPQPPYEGPPPYGASPPYGAPPPYGYGYPVQSDHPRATTILVLGILGIVCCSPCGPFAWVMGHRALREIDSSAGSIGGRSQVMAGYVCGIIATALLALSLVYVVLDVAFIGALFATDGTPQ